MTDFNAIVIAFSIGMLLGSIISTTARICGWWYGRRINRIEATTKQKMAAKLAAL